MPSISGQHVLVIGGSSGMGFAVAKLCLAENVRVAIASSNQTKVDDAIKRLSTEGKTKPTGYTIDLNSNAVEANLESLLDAVTKQGSDPLDHIITTAGKPDMKPLTDVSMEYLTKTATVPVFASILLAKVGTKYLHKKYTSSIIFTSGQVAEKPQPGYFLFAAYGAALHGLVRSLALDLAPFRFNVVSPGATETELWGEHREMLRGIVSEKSLLGKPASPDEVAEAYIYLMRNTDATGSLVSSNAGSTLQ
ncbi:putative short chain dehydrogenase/ reductase [Xylariaceae sp. FL1651]|nr:putative short chain dehydrogenase/ reductase [Xylariaceae sp. FL1651]